MKLSILIPVYNETKTVLDLLELVENVKIDKEIVSFGNIYIIR